MSNSIDLVTIVCSRDRNIQELQSYSLDLMVTDTCDHYVVIEDYGMSIEEWQTLLSPYYNRHRLHLMPSLIPQEYYLNDSYIKNGWHRSAVLKLLIAEKIKAKRYLMLDAKNFFICKQKLSEWPVNDGNGIIEKYDNRNWIEIDEFCLRNNITIPNEVYMSATPFIVDTGIVKEIIKFDIFSLFFEKRQQWSSEIFLYSLFTQQFGNRLQHDYAPNITFWDNERELTSEVFNEIYSWPNMKTFGLHRNILKLNLDLTELKCFLVSIGFNKGIVENALTA